MDQYLRWLRMSHNSDWIFIFQGTHSHLARTLNLQQSGGEKGLSISK